MSQALRIALIDYGMGNLRSVSKAIEKNGDRVEWVHSPKEIMKYDLLVLPGVGAFFHAVQNLKKLNLFDPIKEWIQRKKPFLGICLGYQLLFEESEEGEKQGLGLSIFKGKVKKFPALKDLNVPHMGWNQVNPMVQKGTQKERFLVQLFKKLPKRPYFYFVHSYFPVPADKELISTECVYGVPFASSIYKENLFACQFHPEKSGFNGLNLMKNFLSLYRH